MNITASLAYTQLIRKRSRSMATILAIILSTALTTAVCSLVISVNEMLIQMMGETYGNYRGAYLVMLLIPALILGILILGMSIIVISNVFRISAGERLSQFGTLKCVGATGKQILETIMYESVFLSIIGVPLGTLLGIGFTYLAAKVVNYYFDDFNSLVHMMMTEITLTLKVVIDWRALLFSAVVSILTVLFSAYQPARGAAKKSATECIKQVEVTRLSLSKKEKQKSSLLFGKIETGLAFTNVKRNRRSTKSSITVLTISIILFIFLSGLYDIARRVEQYIYPDMKQTVIVDYTCSCEERMNPNTGRREVRYTKPMDIHTATQISEELKAYTQKDFIAFGNDYDTYFAILSNDVLTEEMKNALEYKKWDTQNQYEFEVEIISLEQSFYSRVCDLAGVEEGAAILLNSYSYNDKGTEKRITPFKEDIQSIDLEKADGTATKLEIEGILTTDEIPEELFYLNVNPVRIILPDAQSRGYSWCSSPEDVDDYISYAEKVMNKYFPEGDSKEYMEVGFSTRVYRTEDYAKVMNIAIMVVTVFLYSFVVLLALIGMINVISTMSNNVQMRAREFAVLQSIGMTKKDLDKMLNMESLFCIGKALLYGLPIGVISIWLVNYGMIQLMPIGMSIPWESIIMVLLGVAIIIWSTIHITTKKMRGQSIIENIRML